MKHRDVNIFSENPRPSRVVRQMPDFTRRRNFLPTFLLTVLLWLVWVLFFVSFAPETNLLIFLFYALFFLANFLTFSLLLANSRRGFLIALTTTSLLFLNQIKQAHILNFILLGGLLLSIELYFRKR